MKKNLLILLGITFSALLPLHFGYAEVADVKEVSCSQFGISGTGNQCFDGGVIYEGYQVDTLLDKYINNASTNKTPHFIFEVDPWTKEHGMKVTTNPLQGTRWFVPNMTNDVPGATWRSFTNKGQEYFAREIGLDETKEILRNAPGSALRFISKGANTSRNNPAVKVTFTTKAFTGKQHPSAGWIPDKNNAIIHHEHLFYYPAWCGDGVVDSQFGEKYDDGANNGRPGYASTDCQTKNPPAPIPTPGYCDGASNGVPTEVAPKNLCKTGTPSLVVEKNGKFTWTCGGINGGDSAVCEAPKKVVPPTPIIPEKCDQTFHDTLRLNYGYRLYDTYTNSNSYAHTLNNFVVNFRENYGDDMNKDGKFTYDHFEWVAPYKNGATVSPGAKGVKIIHANPKYELIAPPKQRKKDNVYIEYIINGKGKNNFAHKECISYEVTWCGDGVVDTNENEICDPNDPNKKDWGSAGCNVNTCQPQEASLEIKKFVKNKDSQTASTAEKVVLGEVFPYTFEVRNSGTTDAPSAKVVDVFPYNLEVIKTGEGNGWKCEQSEQRMSCFYNKTIKAGEKAPTITAQVKIKDSVVSGTVIRNVAAVCVSDPSKPMNDPSQCQPNREICQPGDKDYNPNTKSCDPSTVVVENDLKIKKFAGNRDGQISSDALNVAPGQDFTYTYRVTTSGNKDQKKVTVTDTFPVGVVVTGFKNIPNNWNCNYSQKKVDNKNHSVVVCQTPTMKANTIVDIVVSAKMLPEVNDIISEGAKTLGLRNIAYVCSEEVPGKTPNNGENPKTCDTKCTDPNDPSCTPKPPVQECSPIPEHPHYDPACVIPSKPVDLEIKKYVKEITQKGDSQDAPVTVDKGETFNYYYVFENNHNQAIDNVVIKDTFPAHLSFTGSVRITNAKGNDVTSDFSIKQGKISVYGKTHITLIAHKKTSLEGKSGKYTVIVPVKISENVPNNVNLANMVYICGDNTNPDNQPKDNNGKNICEKTPECTSENPDNPSCMPTPPPEKCTPENNPYKDPACITVADDLDLAIKKYVNTYDAQPGNPVSLETNSEFNYILKVKVKSGFAKGTTTVKDKLPSGVKLNSSKKITGEGWTCLVDGDLIICNTTQEVATGKYFSEITIPAIVTAGSSSTIRNDATVYNPNEKPSNACHKDGKEISGSEQNCENDPDNTDPAIINTPGTTGGGGYADPYATIMCVNDVAVLKEYSNSFACRADWEAEKDAKKKYAGGCVPTKDYNLYNEMKKDEVRKAIQASCEKPTNPPSGGGGIPPSGGGGYGGNPYCGDGIVNRIDEQCDLGTSINNENKLCTSKCQLPPTTNPGENPISYKISIPTFSKIVLGKSHQDLDFASNGLVVGRNANIFSLGDVVNLQLTSLYKVPIHVESDRRFSISQDKLLGNPVESTIDRYYQSQIPSWTNSHGKKWYVIGEGDFLMPKSAISYNGITCTQEGAQFRLCHINNSIETIPLFKGIELQGFKGGTPTTSAKINLKADFDLASFPVKVLNSRLSTNGLYREFEKISNNHKWKEAKDVRDANNHQTSLSGLFADNAFETNLENQTHNLKQQDRLVIKSLSDLESHKLKGNNNVYAIKGDVTITCDATKNFKLSGVKTLLVEGDLNINCDTSYLNANDSWAFIVKNGNITLNKEVKNISGVFVSIGGKITQNDTTTNILRVDGTMYGDATELFNKRTYARATNSYEILTTGTVITYSNRALRNPPPLLAQYLNAYKVQRVVQ